LKVLLAGGGTGGHVYPALAIGNELRYRHPDWDISFAGRHDSIEGRVVPADGFELHELFVSGYERYYSRLKKIKVAGRALVSVKQSLSLLSALKPACVIGTGGYICGPIVLAAWLRGIPTMLCEQNVIPGFTIKTLSRVADRVCLPFEEARTYMNKKNRCVLTGNPVRREFSLYDRHTARKSLQMGETETLMLSFGGSLGARSINNAMADGLAKLCADPSRRVVHVTGKGNYASFLERAGHIPHNARVLEYTNDMAMLLNAADIAIGRSGAMSVSEINYVGVAAIYVPLPGAVFDHQTKNAMFSVGNDAAVMLKDEDLDGDLLCETIDAMLSSPKDLSAMAENSRRIGIRNSSELIAIEIEKLVM
jgi:UDP-N-acetylglucosamine--N-acetylmuramyl-(pentapeptide) pyrophosphoryl-undecaprenol N-acetylglucosamine transferase